MSAPCIWGALRSSHAALPHMGSRRTKTRSNLRVLKMGERNFLFLLAAWQEPRFFKKTFA